MAAGCGSDRLDYIEVKDIDERLTDDEVQTFVRIVEGLPERKLPPLPPVFATPPEWAPSRTLPVNELLAEEQKTIDERWDVGRLAERLERLRRLGRLLKQERLTREQFVGLSLTIGMALSRGTLRAEQDLDEVIERGKQAIERLSRNTRSFAAHPPEGQYYVLSQAAWLARIDRAEHLKRVPLENVALLERHREVLAGVFAAEFTTNPLDPLADPLDEWGIPFEELPDTGRDDELTWDPAEAIIGRDRLQPVSTGHEVQ
ncbi:MAG TPA: hypothetical protein VML55_06305 [Planctomycetaceae bacterium]|nr:hypothetical protein [Planctomycetaceae bacterium]